MKGLLTCAKINEEKIKQKGMRMALVFTKG